MRRPRTRTAPSPTCIADLGAGKPMDRLVCGDVGFGKTEVALRAAFVAAMAGLQVALVAPTTLLARQHYQNFLRALPGLPDRDRPPVAAGPGRRRRRRPRRGSKAGKVDIVIGTHAILAKSVEFRKLGLVIVDEEQRFGVTHKERLKALRADVHVLTLTATPIPRTLQMAMSGLRELSRHPDAAGRPPRGAHLRHALGPGGGPRGAAARALSRRPELLRRAAHRRPARHRGIPARGGARGPLRRRPRPDGADRGRGADERLLRPQIRGAALDHDRRERARHPQRQHPDRPPRRPLRPRPALPAARPRRPGQDPRLCLSHHARRPADDRDRRQAAARCSPASTASAPASSSPPTISTSAAPAICSATSSRAISGRSASSSTSRCSRRRSSRPRRAALEAPRDALLAADHASTRRS